MDLIHARITSKKSGVVKLKIENFGQFARAVEGFLNYVRSLNLGPQIPNVIAVGQEFADAVRDFGISFAGQAPQVTGAVTDFSKAVVERAPQLVDALEDFNKNFGSIAKSVEKVVEPTQFVLYSIGLFFIAKSYSAIRTDGRPENSVETSNKKAVIAATVAVVVPTVLLFAFQSNGLKNGVLNAMTKDFSRLVRTCLHK